jgi:hypothetical protein
MNAKVKFHTRLPSAMAGFVLAASGLISYGSTIVLNTFDNSGDLGSWQANNTTLQWLGTQDAGGTATPGAMMVAYTNSGNPGWQSPQPQRNLGAQAFSTSNYWSVSFDFKIDPNSSPGADAPFGHVQIIPVDNNWTWLPGIGWTAITDDFTNWQHLEFGFAPPYGPLNALVVQVGDNGFTGDVIFYVDNLKVNPIPSTLFVNQFTNANETTGWSSANWAAPGSVEWVSTPDAGGATPPGSIKLNCNFNNVPNNYQQCVFSRAWGGDSTRFTYLDLDVKLDPSSSTMVNGNTYGHFEVILQDNFNPWTWHTVGAFDLTSANTAWTHVSYPVGGLGLTNVGNLILKLGGGWAQDGFTNSVFLYVDNIKLWTPQTPPTIASLKPSGPGGLQIVCTAPTDDWQRQNIVTPAETRNYSWASVFQPVTYAFTIASFPDPIAHPGFEAHAYLVNYDTLPGPNFDETYPGVDWNAADLVDVKFQNNGGGGVDFSFNFKTNLPGANVNNTVAVIHDTSPLGRWAVTFNNATTVTLTTPSGGNTNFTIAPEVANAFAAQMTLHFGTFKNQIRNNGVSATFSHIEVTGVPNPIDETFPGPGLNPDPANPFWRLAADPAGIVWTPAGTAWWLTWTIPDTGFGVQTSLSVNGPWSDLVPPYVSNGADNRSAAIPGPAGNIGFFRLIKTGP